MSLVPSINPEENGGSEKVKGFEEGTQLVSSRAGSYIFYDTKNGAWFLLVSFIFLSKAAMLINRGSHL